MSAAPGGGLDLPPLAEEDHVCPSCPLDYRAVPVAAALDRLAALPAGLARAVGDVPAHLLGVRPAADVWSVAEYVAHVRDVFVVYTVRLHRARKEDRPAVEPMLNDLRARRFRYRERPVPPVLDDLAHAVTGFRDEIGATRDDEWDREITRLPSERRTARWLVRQALHEGVHHLADVRSVGRRVARPDGAGA